MYYFITEEQWQALFTELKNNRVICEEKTYEEFIELKMHVLPPGSPTPIRDPK